MSKTKGELNIRNRSGAPIAIRGTLPQIMRALARASVSLDIEIEETLKECGEIIARKEGLKHDANKDGRERD